MRSKQSIIFDLIIEKLEIVMEECEKENISQYLLTELEDVLYYIKQEKLGLDRLNKNNK